MASVKNQRKLKQLFDQSMTEGGNPRTGLALFRTRMEQSLGVFNDGPGTVQRFEADNSERCLDAKDWGIGEVCYSLIGERWRDTLDQFYGEARMQRFEGIGGTISAGDTPYVSAALDVVAGLMNARALARAADPEWIWDQMCGVQEASSEGGFHIGTRLNPSNQPKRDLGDNEQIPTLNFTATRIHRNRTLNQGGRVKVNLWQMRFDTTGQVMEEVEHAAVAILQERERKVADALLGVSKSTTLSSTTSVGTPGEAVPIIQDGLLWFPYLSGSYGTSNNAGASGFVSPENQLDMANYGNNGTGGGDGVGLTDYMAIVRAIQTLTSNRDPFTRLPITVPFVGMQFFVPTEAAKVQLEYLLQAKVLWQIMNATVPALAAFTATTSEYNLVKAMNLRIHSSQFWANRLVDVGAAYVGAAAASPATLSHQTLTNTVGDTYATAGSVMSYFLMGRFQEALTYWQLMPYQSIGVPLGSVEYGDQTVLIQDHRERGQAFWHNPRYVYRTWA